MLLLKYEKGRVAMKMVRGSTLLYHPRQITETDCSLHMTSIGLVTPVKLVPHD